MSDYKETLQGVCRISEVEAENTRIKIETLLMRRNVNPDFFAVNAASTGALEDTARACATASSKLENLNQILAEQTQQIFANRTGLGNSTNAEGLNE